MRLRNLAGWLRGRGGKCRCCGAPEGCFHEWWCPAMLLNELAWLLQSYRAAIA